MNKNIENEKDIFITLLEFANNNLTMASGEIREAAKRHLLERGYDVENTPTLSTLFNRAINYIFENRSNPDTGGAMNIEAYFKLLDYEKLKEAREASLKSLDKANKSLMLSFGAFFISTIMLISSLLVPQSVRIDNSQFSKLSRHFHHVEREISRKASRRRH